MVADFGAEVIKVEHPEQTIKRRVIVMLMKVEKQGAVMFDPRSIVKSSDAPIAARVPALDRLRLGILDNSKWNVNKILRGSASAPGRSIRFAAVNYYVSTAFRRTRRSS